MFLSTVMPHLGPCARVWLAVRLILARYIIVVLAFFSGLIERCRVCLVFKHFNLAFFNLPTIIN